METRSAAAGSASASSASTRPSCPAIAGAAGDASRAIRSRPRRRWRRRSRAGRRLSSAAAATAMAGRWPECGSMASTFPPTWSVPAWRCGWRGGNRSAGIERVSSSRDARRTAHFRHLRTVTAEGFSAARSVCRCRQADHLAPRSPRNAVARARTAFSPWATMTLSTRAVCCAILGLCIRFTSMNRSS